MLTQKVNPFAMASLHIVYDNLSPLDEKRGRYGMSHMVEHLLGSAFDRVRSMLRRNAIDHEFCTTPEHVYASFTGTASAMRTIAPAMVDVIRRASSSEISRAVFRSERDAIINECADEQADSTMYLGRLALNKIYGLTKHSYDPAYVSKIDYEQAVTEYAKYIPHPTRIVYIGPEELKFPDIEYGKAPKILPFSGKINMNPEDSDVSFGDEYTTILCMGTAPIKCDADFAAMNVALTMLNADDGVIMRRLRGKRPLVYSCDAFIHPFRNIAVPIVTTGTSTKKATETIAVLLNILENPVPYLSKKRFAEFHHMYRTVMEQKRIMMYASPELYTRENLIKDYSEIESITYDQVIDAVIRHSWSGSYRVFAV